VSRNLIKKNPWLESASEPSDRRLSAKLVPAFTDTECHRAKKYRIVKFCQFRNGCFVIRSTNALLRGSA
jgi:hypothetical protein